MDMQELAKAFEEKPNKNENKKTEKKDVETKPKKKFLPIAVFVAGLVLLISGVIFLVTKINTGLNFSNAERLVEIGTFIKDGDEKVVWHFTEIGKGTLTTDGHTNDYEFIWTIEGDTLKIETKWIRNLNDEFKFKLDNDKLILNDNIIFIPTN